MRYVVALVLALAGCSAQGLPLENGAGGAGSGGNGGSGGVADMSRMLGGSGAKCTTACDCQPGLACRQGMCGMSQVGPIYCCDDANCPSGSFCQSSTGNFGQCGANGGGGNGGGFGGGGGTGGFGGGFGGGGGTGGFGGGFGGGGRDGGFPPPGDGGLGGFCSQIPCQASGICSQLGCGACSKGVCGGK